MLSIDVTFDDSQLQRIQQIPVLLMMKGADKCMSAMARPIIRRAQQLAPDSRKTQTRKKWGPKFKNNPAWQNSSKESMGWNVFKTSFGGVVYVGYRWPKGNKGQFGLPTVSRRVFYWGKDSGKQKPRANPTFLEKAFRETRSEQEAAFVAALASFFKEHGLG